MIATLRKRHTELAQAEAQERVAVVLNAPEWKGSEVEAFENAETIGHYLRHPSGARMTILVGYVARLRGINESL